MNDKLRPDDVRNRITAGKRDRKIVVRRFTSTIDPGSGQPVSTWSDLATVWAAWRRASAREQLAAAEISAAVTDIFDCRWSSVTSTITPEDRVVYDGREYNIEEVAEIGRREGIRIRGHARAE